MLFCHNFLVDIISIAYVPIRVGQVGTNMEKDSFFLILKDHPGIPWPNYRDYRGGKYL